MKLLNRSAFSVLPRQPFVDWVNRLPDDELSQPMTLDEHRQEGTVYLVDEFESEDSVDQTLAASWAQIFENELAAWDEFGDSWPADRSQAMFKEWFEVQPQVLALDLSSQPLMTARLEQ